MAVDLVMTFSDGVGAKSNITVKNVRDTIAPEEVSVVMDTILASDLFSGKNGNLIKKEYATLVETEKTRYDEF
jgi:Protein of unknown function (DUF2922)